MGLVNSVNTILYLYETTAKMCRKYTIICTYSYDYTNKKFLKKSFVCMYLDMTSGFSTGYSLQYISMFGSLLMLVNIVGNSLHY